jgi:hypothetical protein
MPLVTTPGWHDRGSWSRLRTCASSACWCVPPLLVLHCRVVASAGQLLSDMPCFADCSAQLFHSPLLPSCSIIPGSAAAAPPDSMPVGDPAGRVLWAPAHRAGARGPRDEGSRVGHRRQGHELRAGWVPTTITTIQCRSQCHFAAVVWERALGCCCCYYWRRHCRNVANAWSH